MSTDPVPETMQKEYSAENMHPFKGLNYLRESNSPDRFLGLGRGDHTKLANSFGVKREVVSRMVNEINILSLFPNLEKSKAVPLSTLRSRRELILFSQKYDVYTLEVRELRKLVREWRNIIGKNPRWLLTDLQHDLLIGSTLGDANIRQRDKNCMFRVGHSPKQKKYVEWKFEILKEFENSGVKLSQRQIKGRLINTYDFQINAHYVFNSYRNQFYNQAGDKIVTEKTLNELNSRSLAIWLCDDGSYCKKQQYIIFCTNSFTLEEHQLMKKYFEKKWKLSPTIGFRDNKYYYLRFKKEDTAKLVEIVRPFVPKCMQYKIGEENE